MKEPKAASKRLRWIFAASLFAIDLVWVALNYVLAGILSADEALSGSFRATLTSILAKAWMTVHAPVVSLARESGLVPGKFDSGVLHMEWRLLALYFLSVVCAFILGYLIGVMLDWMRIRAQR